MAVNGAVLPFSTSTPFKGAKRGKGLDTVRKSFLMVLEISVNTTGLHLVWSDLGCAGLGAVFSGECDPSTAPGASQPKVGVPGAERPRLVGITSSSAASSVPHSKVGPLGAEVTM